MGEFDMCNSGIREGGTTSPPYIRWPARSLKFSAQVALNLNNRVIEEFSMMSKMANIGHIALGSNHDIIAIVRGVLGHIEFALEDARRGDMDAVIESLLLAKNGGNNLASISTTLRDHGRGDESKKENVCLRNAVSKTLQFLKPAFPKTVEFEFSETGDEQVAYVNGNQVEQILINIIRNAVQALPDRKGKVIISVHSLRRDSDDTLVPSAKEKYVAFSVKDTGHGMSEETFTRISEPFFTTKQGSGGTGLGLLMVKYLASENGGHVVASTMERRDGATDHGSIFTVFLPKAARV